MRPDARTHARHGQARSVRKSYAERPEIARGLHQADTVYAIVMPTRFLWTARRHAPAAMPRSFGPHWSGAQPINRPLTARPYHTQAPYMGASGAGPVPLEFFPEMLAGRGFPFAR
jgi:hypothetical protein